MEALLVISWGYVFLCCIGCFSGVVVLFWGCVCGEISLIVLVLGGFLWQKRVGWVMVCVVCLEAGGSGLQVRF